MVLHQYYCFRKRDVLYAIKLMSISLKIENIDYFVFKTS